MKTEIDNKLPSFPDSLYTQLPQFLPELVSIGSSSQEKDMLLLGAMTSISSCLPKIYGIYDDVKVYSNLYLFVTAPPSSGKGKLNKCKLIVQKIHDSLRKESDVLTKEHKRKLAEYIKNKKTNFDLVKPTKSIEKMLFIPANNSSTGMLQLLFDNDGRGIIFETEGDTLTQAFKSDYGNYSDGFRKAFHHESITYYRRTESEYVDINEPKLSVVLSGTPRQVKSLIPDAENGLFSRFMFYFLDLNANWINPYANNGKEELDLKYKALGDRFFSLYESLNKEPEIKIIISEEQSLKSYKYFSLMQAKYKNIKSEHFIANIRRLGLVSFRLIMILTALRIMEDGDVSNTRECSDEDFDSVLKMIDVLIQHSRKVFFTLPRVSDSSQYKSLKEEFIEALPKQFKRQDYLLIASNKDISVKTADRYINALVKDKIINKKSHNNYINPLFKDDEETKDIEEIEDPIDPASSLESSTSAESTVSK